MVDVVADVSSLSRTPRGSITGQIFLRGPTGDFPEERWSDFPVVILGWWIAGLTRVLAGQERSFQGMFMDGPYAFVVHRGVGDSARMAWGRTGEETSIGIVDVRALLQSAVAEGRLVLEACRARSWSSTDLETLEREIAQSAV
jgi:hypothetical protein